jgi:hypothetical protein
MLLIETDKSMNASWEDPLRRRTVGCYSIGKVKALCLGLVISDNA